MLSEGSKLNKNPESAEDAVQQSAECMSSKQQQWSSKSSSAHPSPVSNGLGLIDPEPTMDNDNTNTIDIIHQLQQKEHELQQEDNGTLEAVMRQESQEKESQQEGSSKEISQQEAKFIEPDEERVETNLENKVDGQKNPEKEIFDSFSQHSNKSNQKESHNSRQDQQSLGNYQEIECKNEPADIEMRQDSEKEIPVGECGELAMICAHDQANKVSMCIKCLSFFCEVCFFDRHLTLSHGGDQNVLELSTLIKQSLNKVYESIEILRDTSQKLSILSHPEIQRRKYRQQLLQQINTMQESQQQSLFEKMSLQSDVNQQGLNVVQLPDQKIDRLQDPEAPPTLSKEEMQIIKQNLQKCSDLYDQSESILKVLKTSSAFKTDQQSIALIAEVYTEINQFVYRVTQTSENKQMTPKAIKKVSESLDSTDPKVKKGLPTEKQGKKTKRTYIKRKSKNEAEVYDFGQGVSLAEVESKKQSMQNSKQPSPTDSNKTGLVVSVTRDKDTSKFQQDLSPSHTPTHRNSKAQLELSQQSPSASQQRASQQRLLTSFKLVNDEQKQLTTISENEGPIKEDIPEKAKRSSRIIKNTKTLRVQEVSKRPQRNKKKVEEQPKETKETKETKQSEKKGAGSKRTHAEMEQKESDRDSSYVGNKRAKRGGRTSGKKSDEKKKQRESAPPTKGKDMSFITKTDEQQEEKKSKNEKQEPEVEKSKSFCSGDESSNNAESPGQVVRGKQLARLSGKQTNVICKISLQRCLLFDIQSRDIATAFSSMKIPEHIKSQSSLLLTSAQHMLILGGEEKGQYLGQNTLFNLATHEFVEREPMPEAKVQFGCIFFGGCVFVVGGWREFFVKGAEMYSIENDQWLSMPQLNDEREDISLCIVQDRYLFAFGNVTTRGRRFKPDKKGNIEFTFERIDVATCTQEAGKGVSLNWELLSVKTDFNEHDKMPSMKHMGCFNNYTNKNQILIFGGGNKGTNMSQRCYKIDLDKKKLSKAGQLARPDRFANHLFFKKDENLYLFGESYLHMYDLRKATWIKENVLPLNNSLLS